MTAPFRYGAVELVKPLQFTVDPVDQLRVGGVTKRVARLRDTQRFIAEGYQRRLALLDPKPASGGGAYQRRARKSRNGAPL